VASGHFQAVNRFIASFQDMTIDPGSLNDLLVVGRFLGLFMIDCQREKVYEKCEITFV
jgi:hypothetical protein